MAIKTITPRLPRVGTIRLGTKKVSARGFEYPVNCEYFVFPSAGEPGHDLIAGIFDENTSVLPVTFPINDLDVVLSDFYRRHTASGLQCRGDGETGLELQFEERTDAKGKKYQHKEMVEVPCATRGCQYPLNKECGPSGILAFSIHGIAALGVWHLTTHSIHAIQEFRAVLTLALTVFGRLTNLPFELYRKPIEVNPDGRKKTVWTVGLRLAAGVSQNLLHAGGAQAPVAAIGAGSIEEPFVDAADAAMAEFGGQDNQPPATARSSTTARTSSAGEPPAKEPAHPRDAKKVANDRLWAVLGEHGLALKFTKEQVTDVRKQLLIDHAGTDSARGLDPGTLNRIADLVEADPERVIMAAHHKLVGNQAIEVEAELVTDDENIPDFDAPVPPVDQVDGSDEPTAGDDQGDVVDDEEVVE